MTSDGVLAVCAWLPPIQMQILLVFTKCFFDSCWELYKGDFLTIILCDLHAFIFTLCSYRGMKVPKYFVAHCIPSAGTRKEMCVCSALCMTLPRELGSAGFYNIMDNVRKES